MNKNNTNTAISPNHSIRGSFQTETHQNGSQQSTLSQSTTKNGSKYDVPSNVQSANMQNNIGIDPQKAKFDVPVVSDSTCSTSYYSGSIKNLSDATSSKLEPKPQATEGTQTVLKIKTSSTKMLDILKTKKKLNLRSCPETQNSNSERLIQAFSKRHLQASQTDNIEQPNLEVVQSIKQTKYDQIRIVKGRSSKDFDDTERRQDLDLAECFGMRLQTNKQEYLEYRAKLKQYQHQRRKQTCVYVSKPLKAKEQLYHYYNVQVHLNLEFQQEKTYQLKTRKIKREELKQHILALVSSHCKIVNKARAMRVEVVKIVNDLLIEATCWIRINKINVRAGYSYKVSKGIADRVQDLTISSQNGTLFYCGVINKICDIDFSVITISKNSIYPYGKNHVECSNLAMLPARCVVTILNYYQQEFDSCEEEGRIVEMIAADMAHIYRIFQYKILEYDLQTRCLKMEVYNN